MKHLLTITLAIVFALTLFTQTARADGIIIPEPPVCLSCPVPPPPANEIPYLTVETQRVTVSISQQIATTRVDQIFRNDSDFSLEGTYIFPVPENAAISDFAMWVNGERIEGELHTKEEARRIYDEIVRQRLDPALLEYVGRDLFQASIFPIDPGDSRRVELEYRQILPIDNGLVQYVYPLSTEKFSAEPLENVAITIEVESNEAIKTIYAVNHPADISRDGVYRARVGWEAANVLPDDDFALYYTVSPQEIGVNLLTYQPPDADGFFTLFIAPDVEVSASEIVAKDVILVLDTSGSMEGEKMEQAREALKFVLNRLNPQDRFNLVTFSTSVRTFARQLAPTASVSQAIHFVDDLTPGGSTDINRALLEAFTFVDATRPAVVIFLTDGLPTSGVVETPLILNNVEQAAPDNVRIFPFGVGDDVDTLLLDTLAQALRGLPAYVRPGSRIDEQVSDFYTQISTPVLADMTLSISGNLTLEEQYPHPLPDLFAGTQLVLTGRYRGSGPAVITLTGVVNGETRHFRYDDLMFPARYHAQFDLPQPTDFIPRLWATRKIGYLLNQIRLRGENREAIDEIVDLSVRYGIITPYTSFLVEEPNLALRESGRDEAADMAFVEAEAAANSPTSGAAAVERSVEESALSMADRAAPPPTSQNGEGAPVSRVKTVGDKAFLWQDGVWTDTTFDPAMMTPQIIPFPSAELFALLEAHPSIGRYFALGERVIVVLDGTVYAFQTLDG